MRIGTREVCTCEGKRAPGDRCPQAVAGNSSPLLLYADSDSALFNGYQILLRLLPEENAHFRSLRGDIDGDGP